MFCSKCGAQVQDTASFCRRCGSPLKQEPKIMEDITGTTLSGQNEPGKSEPEQSVPEQSAPIQDMYRQNMYRQGDDRAKKSGTGYKGIIAGVIGGIVCIALLAGVVKMVSGLVGANNRKSSTVYFECLEKTIKQDSYHMETSYYKRGDTYYQTTTKYTGGRPDLFGTKCCKHLAAVGNLCLRVL